MKKLNIIGRENSSAKIQIVKVEFFSNPEESDELFTVTDGKGSYSLSKDGSVWWADKSNKNILEDESVEGNPKKEYKGKPLYQVLKVNGKLGVWDTTIFEKILGSYNNMDDLIEAVYEDNVLGSKIKYLDFDNE